MATATSLDEPKATAVPEEVLAGAEEDEDDLECLEDEDELHKDDGDGEAAAKKKKKKKNKKRSGKKHKKRRSKNVSDNGSVTTIESAAEKVAMMETTGKLAPREKKLHGSAPLAVPVAKDNVLPPVVLVQEPVKEKQRPPATMSKESPPRVEKPMVVVKEDAPSVSVDTAPTVESQAADGVQLALSGSPQSKVVEQATSLPVEPVVESIPTEIPEKLEEQTQKESPRYESRGVPDLVLVARGDEKYDVNEKEEDGTTSTRDETEDDGVTCDEGPSPVASRDMYRDDNDGTRDPSCWGFSFCQPKAANKNKGTA